jgi:hypothetical protein
MARVFTEKDVRRLIAEAVAPLKARIGDLERENARLHSVIARLKKDSSTSSKPPSSDLVKPPKRPRKDGQNRQRGGQPGHEQHWRPEFPPEAIDKVAAYTLDCCPDCGGTLRSFERPADVLQQVEITAAPTIVTEHRGLACLCPRCESLHCASAPKAVERAGLFGPRLPALPATRLMASARRWMPVPCNSAPARAKPLWENRISSVSEISNFMGFRSSPSR